MTIKSNKTMKTEARREYGIFKEKVLDNLTGYKDNILNITEKGCYRGKGYGYVLPNDYVGKNLISPLDGNFNEIDKTIKLHWGFSHLNSSQAMTVNFFYPFRKRILGLDYGDLSMIMHGIAGNDIEINELELEKISGKEKSETTKTNFDVYLKGICNRQIYIEAKYTEDGFGSVKFLDMENANTENSYIMSKIDKDKEKAINDYNKYNEKFRVYEKVIEENGLDDVFKKEYFEKAEFYRNYQIMRNVLHVDSNSSVYFLIPKGNAVAEYELGILDEIFEDQSYRDKTGIIYWEDLLATALGHLRELKKEDAVKYFEEFERKYLHYDC